ncbi:heme lyase CcmF/NrfE family subunit [Pelagibacteraceae bacterium]|jgi:cytochrome c-type biogenesis protein CcmF|nr:heme lyase CcmF/NrfE family subunit [Pelagibacteraceae bacterium]MDC3233156.1 heme lyase CcmF/NrfE family subunit [Pelagibacteraceae bacterium]|tara:strand:- start:988 stop:2874 length:1887 start_codon:yes stop_codon:yes gene_type:complete
MLSNIGNSLLSINILLSIFIIYFSFQNLKDSKNLINRNIYNMCLIQSTSIIICFFTLIAGFIISDFSLINVYQNSHSLKPIFYKISGTWGNHEGSLLLWVIILTIFSFFFLFYNKDHPKKYRIYTLITQNFLIIGFLFFLLFNSNPFSVISPVPKEGLGLNPILQDPALAIHPPLLYIGFVGSSIYFSAAIASLLTNYSGKLFATSIKNWVLLSWSFQTVGILVGSIWAYYELGWGGFWFWDPVENASLLPWFAMTALMHSLIVLEKRDQLYFWVIILCLLTFILSVTGTFLVRSGILNSVHTFANDPSRGTYILIFLSIMILVSVLLLFKKFKSGNYNLNSNSKETFILINNWFMIFYLITVLLGTIYPIFTEVLSSHKVSVGPPFYNTVIIPIVVLFLFFMSLGPQAKWIKNKFTNLKLLLTILLGSIFINFLIFHFFKSYSLISNLIIISSFFLILSSLRDSIQIVKNKNYNYPRIVSHTAFGFLILFIGLNYNFSSEKDFNFKLGDTKQFENFSIKFQKLQQKEFKNYTAIVGKFKIKDLQKKSEQFLNPEIRIYKNPSTLTYEASIRTGLLRDYYITMSNIDRSDYYNIKFQKKPFMIWIWISVIFISVGGFLRLFQNANKNY